MAENSGSLQGDISKLLVRIAVGGLMMFHGIAKLLNGIGFIEQSLNTAGLPGAIAYGVYIGEIVGPIMVIVGFGTRFGAAAIAVDMLVALSLVHSRQFFSLAQGGSWSVELPVFYLLCALALVLMGSGRYGISRGKGILA